MNARNLAIVGALAVLAGAPLIAQQSAPAQPMTAPGKADVTRVAAGTYKADPAHTLVQWRVDHLGFTPYFGLFGQIDGTLVFDPKAPRAAKVDVTIPVSSVTTASAELTAHLLRAGKDGGKPDFFGASPASARFVSTSVVPTGRKTAKIIGDLTLNGVTRPVSLDARFYGAGAMWGKENLGFEATASINRSEFGITTGIPMVSDKVDLTIAAAFVKQ